MPGARTSRSYDSFAPSASVTDFVCASTAVALVRTIVIPSAALFEDAANDSFYVFVAGPDRKAHRTRVTVGIRNSSAVQIISGLTPGQIVITSGGYALSDGLQVKVTVAQS